MAETRIEWADSVWNPVTGCSKASEGCRNCYAGRMAKRLAGRCGYPADDPFAVTLHPERLEEPLHWRTPRRVFVNSMGDLFHPDVPDEYILRVFAVMELTKHHTFLILAKRPKRMQELLTWDCFREEVWAARDRLLDDGHAPGWLHERFTYWDQYDEHDAGVLVRTMFSYEPGPAIPFPNIWFGVSAENQAMADERIPVLLQTPAAVRFVSCEPLLGAVYLAHFLGATGNVAGLDWVIAGGETGPGARPMHPDWARSLRDQCQAAGVPFFFKSRGEHLPVYDRDDDPDWRQCTEVERETPHGRWLNLAGGYGFHGQRVVRVVRIGKRHTGRRLDGREWNQMPEVDKP